ncbi:MAG TPA: peptidoglycan DD-metalloendopeptidase family protein [Bacteroidales bacterium]|nr:peptidoglycan DD-metalloendopeptidase family protein [Bacteroidales bacterium]
MKRRKLAVIFIIVVLLLGISYLLYLYAGRNARDIEIEASSDSPETGEPVVKTLYELPVDSFYIEQGKVRRNQTLADILKQFNLAEGSLNRLFMMSDDVFDVRKMRAGNDYTAFISLDTLYQLKYLVYEHTPVEYVLFDFNDSLRIAAREKDVKLIEKTSTGKIATSLWNTMIDNQINPMIAIELSEIYAWTIDFFGLQEGDSFKVIYSEMYVDTISVAIEKIDAAFFRHADHDYYAIPFTQDSTRSFYDVDGNSLRKAFLKAPLRFSRISSRYSHSRLHPILKIRRPHHGIDYAAPVGTPVHAIGDGEVVKLDYDDGAGRMIKIKHNSVYTTVYMHLSRYGKGIHHGAFVKQGDVIGYVGSSGLSTGPHLDFRFYKNGSPVDPLKVEAPPVEPVREENRQAFDSVKILVLKRLNSF